MGRLGVEDQFDYTVAHQRGEWRMPSHVVAMIRGSTPRPLWSIPSESYHTDGLAGVSGDIHK